MRLKTVHFLTRQTDFAKEYFTLKVLYCSMVHVYV